MINLNKPLTDAEHNRAAYADMAARYYRAWAVECAQGTTANAARRGGLLDAARFWAAKRDGAVSLIKLTY